MKLHEYQSKLIFSREGIPIPQGKLASTPGEAKQISDEIGCPVVLKAQVLTGGRGKSGGIRLAKSPQEVENESAKIFGSKIKGFPVRKLLIDKAVGIRQEIYLGITNDRKAGKPVVIACGDGGIDIEEIALTKPERIIKSYIDSLIGLRDYQIRELATEINLSQEYSREFQQITMALWRVFTQIDATLAEINPLVITTEGNLLALDGKIIIDDNALYRQNQFLEFRDLSAESSEEAEARKFDLSYIRLTGNIGCLVNGAGLAMATMDNINICGGEPANFLDIGGGANADKVSAALNIILSSSKVKSVLINIFGGITRCDEVAKGILRALNENDVKAPLVIRLVGTNSEEAKQLLLNAKQITADTLFEAAQMAVNVTQGNLL
ncbi:MAG: ADP-forming succinate--CoA ligase subunit beta [Anaerolineaceae bacterium]|nr:ADP-forming succinate--CoA ligase subunit beta [Anaerolineaceae bacterium]